MYKNVVYNPGLHLALSGNSYPDCLDVDNGVYLVAIRVKKNNLCLMYNYVYYPEVFINSLLLFLLNRNSVNYTDSFLYKSWGDFFCLIDDDLFKSYDVEWNEYLEYLYKDYANLNSYYTNYLVKAHGNNSDYESKFKADDSFDKDLSTVIHRLKKLVFVKDMSYILSFIEHSSKKDFYKLCCMLFNKTVLEGFRSDSPDLSSGDHYVIRDCLFVVRDLDSLVNGLKLKGFSNINQGPQKDRGRVNSMSGFLGCLDASYRLFLYDIYSNVKYNNDLLVGKLSPRDFTFRKIHNQVSGKVSI